MFPPCTPHETLGNQVPDVQRMFTHLISPSIHRINHSPVGPNESQKPCKQTPQKIGFLAMNQNVVHRLPITLTHIAPVLIFS